VFSASGVTLSTPALYPYGISAGDTLVTKMTVGTCGDGYFIVEAQPGFVFFDQTQTQLYVRNFFNIFTLFFSANTLV
jgi:hypothetical protein